MKRWSRLCIVVLICTLTFAGVRPASTRASTDIWVRAFAGVDQYDVITSIAIDPVTPSTLYVADTPYGYIRRSDDKGFTWTPLQWPGYGSAWLTVDPTSPGTVLAACSYSYYGNAVFRSEDKGSTWSGSSDGLDLYTTVLCLTWDLLVPGVVYAGTSSGVYCSVDHGHNWSMTSTSFMFTVRALAADPVTSGLLYAGTQGDGVFRSEDAGTTWAPVSNELGSTDILALAIDPVPPTVVYCGTVGGMYRSYDRGETWISASAGMDPAASVQQIVIDPLAHLTLYAGTSMRVYGSDNGGNEWAPFGTGLTSDYISSLAIDSLDPTILYAGTAGGVWTTQPSYTLATPTSPPEAGSVIRSPDQASFLGGAVVQLTAQPGFGYKFVGWSGDATGAQNPLAVTMGTDKTITADFALSTCAVTLTAPNGSEQWAPGTTHEITWAVTGDTSAISQFGLYLALDGSDPWTYIAWNIGSSERSFSWTVPEVLPSRARVNVVASDFYGDLLASDASDSFFSITSVTKKKLPLVSITSSSKKPWPAGTSQTIQWHVDGKLPQSFHHYSIWASLEDGRNGSWVHLGDSSITSFSWYIPVDVGSARVRVIVYATDVSSLVVADAQSELFSITPASGAYGVKITAPAGGEALHVGDTYDITWTTTGTVPPSFWAYRLFYSWNGGLLWQDAGMAWSGVSYSWTVPQCLSSDCRIMVLALGWNSNILGVAVSAVPFSIAP